MENHHCLKVNNFQQLGYVSLPEAMHAHITNEYFFLGIGVHLDGKTLFSCKDHASSAHQRCNTKLKRRLFTKF